jgi:hypothetical protein
MMNPDRFFPPDPTTVPLTAKPAAWRVNRYSHNPFGITQARRNRRAFCKKLRWRA